MTEAELDPLARLLKLVNQASRQAIPRDSVQSAAHDSGQNTAGIELALEIEHAAERHLRNSVEAARVRGASWQQIGNAFGVSRQAVYKRFGAPETHDARGEIMNKPIVDLQARTEAVFQMLSEDNYAGVKALMTFSCSRLLTKKKVMSVWNQVVSATGPLISCTDTVAQTSDGRNVILQQINQLLSGGLVGQTMLNHEAGEWLGRVAYNGSGKITGLLIVSPLEKHNLPF